MATTTFLRTRVGARILALFFVGAMVPVAVLAVLSSRAVRQQLVDQSEDRLLQMTDATGQLLLERLATTTRAAERSAKEVFAAAGSPVSQQGLSGPLDPGVQGVSLQAGGGLTTTSGAVTPPPVLSEAETDWLTTGEPLVKTASNGDEEMIYLAFGNPNDGDEVAWVQVTSDSIWASAMTLGEAPIVDDLCVFSAAGAPFRCLRGGTSELSKQLPAMSDRSGVRGMVSFEALGQPRSAAWRSIYLRSSYGAPDWFVMVSQTEASVFQPVQGFTYNLLLALAVGMGLVLLLAHAVVSRTMEPLAALMVGTQRLSRRDLSARVEVGSDDEFGDLAKAFNGMAVQLSRQFRQLEASQAIDRAVIEDGDLSAAVGALIDGVRTMLPAQQTTVLLLDLDSDGRAAVCFRPEPADRVTVLPVEATASDLDWVSSDPAGWLVGPGAAEKYLRVAGVPLGVDHIYTAPMVVQGAVVGLVIITSDPRVDFSGEDLDRAFQVIDRAAVALNEVRLRRELSEFGGEALRALANAIDAKSRWTAGHSERVTELARAIGVELILSDEEMDILYRGGMLHDIGKIGVPLEILDFPGRLDREMRLAVEAHPVIGAKIIEPIRSFRPLLGIVLHHHEKWDGSGYPDGLAGTDIPRLARVLAVADVFDAMISPRPYREALPRDFVVSHIREGAGSAFEPAIVAAFDAVMAGGWVHDTSPLQSARP